MDKKYIELFKKLAQATASSAEVVMDYDIKEKGGEGVETATIMRDSYQDLLDKITDAKDAYSMTREDAARLAISTIIVIGQLQGQADQIKHAITSYQTDILPKLQEIVEKAESDESAAQMANEKFIISET